MNESLRPSGWRGLKQTILAPTALASAIRAGLGWAVPALVISLTVITLDVVALPLFLRSLPQMAPQGLSPEMMAGFERTSRIMRPIQILMSPIGLIIRWAIIAFLLYLISVLIDRKTSFRDLFVLVVYAGLIPLLEVIAKNIVLWLRYAFTGTIVIDHPLGLDAVFQPKGAALSTLLQHANVFELWFLGALIIGIHVLCRCSKRWAAAIVLPVWGIWLAGHIAYAMGREVLIKQLGA
ncbi:MAG: YIP1 family protein [Acidobacteria bacterium]|nr:YIP1 family protein [Acidobacteriota bacterium]